MIIANFTDGYSTATAPGLYQWDYGQILEIHGLSLPPAVEVHFAIVQSTDDAKTRIGTTIDKVTKVAIPEFIVEQSRDAVAYIYISDTESGKTVKKINMPITARQKPEAFDAPEDAQLFREAIEMVNAAADRAEDAEKSSEAWAHGHKEYPDRDEDNAKYYADQAHGDATKASQDRASVERTSDDVNNMAMRVNADKEESEQYKSQAAQSAAAALESENNSKASENASKKAMEEAQIAEGQAELFAEQSGNSADTAEQAKNLVMQIGREVTENKEYVDKKIDDFNVLHQQAVQDIDNAGNNQAESINAAGQKAIENIGTGIDPTFTQEGKAADAKATGDKLTELKSDLSYISHNEITDIQPTMTNDNYFYNTSGNTILYDAESGLNKSYGASNSDNWLITVNEGDAFRITSLGVSTGAYAFVSEPISTYANVIARYGVNEQITNELVIIPSGVKYLVVNNNNVGNGKVKKISSEDPIVYKSDIISYEDKINRLSNFCFANYDSENTQLNIFIPCTVGYVCIPLAFRENLESGKHYNVLHIENASIVDNNFNFRYRLTSTGEWECAIKLSGRSDFMGGINHGDEINTSVSWFIDGTFIEDITAISDNKFTELKCVCVSDLYDPSDENTIVAKHGKEYIFTKDGLELKQNVNWLVDASIRESYLCMLPILDYETSAKTTVITQHGYANDDFITYDLFNNDNDAIHSWKRERTEITTFGKEKGLTAKTKQIESRVNSGITHGGYASIYSTMTKSGNNGYNKHYYMIAGLNTDDSVSAGDLWYTNYMYQFDVSK